MNKFYNSTAGKIFAGKKRTRIALAVVVPLLVAVAVVAGVLSMRPAAAATVNASTFAQVLTYLADANTDTITITATGGVLAVPTGTNTLTTTHGDTIIGRFTVGTGATLNIGTSSSETLTIDGNQGGSVITVNGGGTLNMYGGTIKNGKATTLSTPSDLYVVGGGVRVQGSSSTSKALFNMYGGTITQCTAISSGGSQRAYGGGVGARNEFSTFNMYGGTISSNFVSNGGAMHYGADGGGVGHNGSATVTIYAGYIYNNFAQEYGGGIGTGIEAELNGTTTIYNPVIAGNQASEGGGVYGCGSGGIVNLKDHHTAIFNNKHTKTSTNDRDLHIASGTNNKFVLPYYMLGGDVYNSSAANYVGSGWRTAVTPETEVNSAGANKNYLVPGVSSYPYDVTAPDLTILAIIKNLEAKFPEGRVFIVNNSTTLDRPTSQEGARGGGIGGNGHYVCIGEDKDDDYGILTLKKVVDGTGANLTKEFKFTITFNNYSGILMNGSTITGSQTVYLKDGESVTFTNIPTTRTYTITEDDYSDYNLTWSHVNGGSASGKVFSGSIASGKTTVCVTAKNTYKGTTPSTGSVKITKELSGNLPSSITNSTGFSVKVKIGSNYMTVNGSAPNYTYTGTSPGGTPMSVSVNQPITITGIPAGTVCVVEEVSGSGDVPGWTKTVSYSGNNVTVTGGDADTGTPSWEDVPANAYNPSTGGSDRFILHHLNGSDEIFTLEQGVIKNYIGLCAQKNASSPNENASMEFNSARDNTASALVASLLEEDYGALVSNTAFKQLMGIPTSNTVSFNRHWVMRTVARVYEYFYRNSNPDPTLADLFHDTPPIEIEESDFDKAGEDILLFNKSYLGISGNIYKMFVAAIYGMMEQYKDGKTTALNMTYTATDATSGTIAFSHDGWVPKTESNVEQYATRLTWTVSSGTATVTRVRGGATTTYTNGVTGVDVLKTDTLSISYPSGATVKLTLIDSGNYLKAGSIKGMLLKNIATDKTYQTVLVGHSQFVTLKNELTVGSGGGQTVGITNKYTNTTPSTGSVTMYGRKTVEVNGSGTATGGTFTFSIAHTDSSGTNQAYPSGVTVSATGLTSFQTSGNPRTGTITRNSAGDSDFSYSISGLAVGTHYFVLRESGGGGSGWANDTREYLIEVTIPSGGGAGTISRYKGRASSSTAWNNLPWSGPASATGNMHREADGSSRSVCNIFANHYTSNTSIELNNIYSSPGVDNNSMRPIHIDSSTSNIVIGAAYCMDEFNSGWAEEGMPPLTNWSTFTTRFSNVGNRNALIWVLRNGFKSTGHRSAALTTGSWQGTNNLAYIRNLANNQSLTADQAYAATQFAVWRFSNNIVWKGPTETINPSAPDMQKYKIKDQTIWDAYNAIVTAAQAGGTASNFNGALVFKGSSGWDSPNPQAVGGCDMEFAFTNIYTPPVVTGSVTMYGRKTIVGASAPANTDFVFTLSKTDSTGATIAWPSGLTVTVTGGTWNETNKTITVRRTTAGAGNVDFSVAISGLTASSSAATEHFFHLTETTGGGTGWANADNEYLLRVNIPSGGGTGSVNGYRSRDPKGTGTWSPSNTTWTTTNVHGSSTSNRAVFSNTYTPPGVKATLRARKAIDGTVPAGIDWSFIFALYNVTISPGNGNNDNYTLGTQIDTQTVTKSTPGSIVSFDIPSYTTAGTYYYLIKETGVGTGTDGSLWYLSPTQYLMQVVVTGSGSTLTVSTIKFNTVSGNGPWSGNRNNYWGGTTYNNTTVNTVFTNTYTPKPTSTQLKATKTVSGASVPGGTWTFGIALYNSTSSGNQGAQIGTTLNAANGASTVTFNSISYTSANTYYYVIRETATDGNGWVVDRNWYHVEVKVEDVNGQLTVTSRQIRKGLNGGGWGSWGGYSDTNVTFDNTYTTGDLTISKTVTGSPTGIDGNTAFEVRVKIGSNYMTVNTSNEYTGTDTFGSIFDVSVNTPVTITGIPAGTVCVVEEVSGSGDVPGWTKTVSYSGNNVTVTSGSTPVGVTVENSYEQETYPATILGTKKLTGTPVTAQSFVFTLTYTNESGDSQTLPGGVNVNGLATNPQTRTLSAGGDFQFDITGLTPTGSPYYFTLVETTGGSGGPGTWSNSAVEYLIKVEIPSGGGAGTITQYKERPGSATTWASVSWTAGAPGGSSSGGGISATVVSSVVTKNIGDFYDVSNTGFGHTNGGTENIKTLIGDGDYVGFRIVVNDTLGREFWGNCAYAPRDMVTSTSTNVVQYPFQSPFPDNYYDSVAKDRNIDMNRAALAAALGSVETSGLDFDEFNELMGFGGVGSLSRVTDETVRYAVMAYVVHYFTGKNDIPGGLEDKVNRARMVVDELYSKYISGSDAFFDYALTYNSIASAFEFTSVSPVLSVSGVSINQKVKVEFSPSTLIIKDGSTSINNGDIVTLSGSKNLVVSNIPSNGDFTVTFTDMVKLPEKSALKGLWINFGSSNQPQLAASCSFRGNKKIYHAQAGGGDGCQFINTYTAPATVLLKAVKNTTGAPMTAEQFTFALYEFESNGLLKSLPLQTAKNAGAGETGSVIFLPLTFTEAKEYVYYLTETGDEPGWIMDSTRYRIYISVEELDGVLTPEVTYIEADDDGEEIAGRTLRAYDENVIALWPDFTNVYGGPRFPEVGGIGKDTVIAAGITIISTISMLFGGTWIYGKHKRRKLLAR